LAAFFLLLKLSHLVFKFPLVVYIGFILRRQYKMSDEPFLRWLRNYSFSQLLSTVVMLALIECLYVVIWITGPTWWLTGAVGWFVFSVVLAKLSPTMIVPLFYKVEPLDDAELLGRLARLTANTSLKITGLYRIKLHKKTIGATAMLVGFGKARKILLSETLLASLTPDEIEVVLAHEIGHHVYRHLLKHLVVGFSITLATFYLCHRAMPHSLSQIPVYTLAMILLIITLSNRLLGPVANAFGRHFERQCDRYALDQTNLKTAYRSAFLKLVVLNKTDLNPHPLEVVLFHSHPPIAKRLAMADE
jgi:STE24 endopeptidase